jgi:hypothetical protein
MYSEKQSALDYLFCLILSCVCIKSVRKKTVLKLETKYIVDDVRLGYSALRLSCLPVISSDVMIDESEHLISRSIVLH